MGEKISHKMSYPRKRKKIDEIISSKLDERKVYHHINQKKKEFIRVSSLSLVLYKLHTHTLEGRQ